MKSSKKNNIEIVLCIDNIDRLSNTKMQDFFSEISAFAQLTNTKNSFNIILPFCKNKIRSKKSNSEQECFDTKIPIIIRVPPLTKSQWHQLLLKYFQITFCKINTEKFNINLLYGLIDLFIDTNKEINPRFLKKYINDIYIEYIMQNNKDDYEIIYICASYVIAHNYKNIKISDLIDNNNEAELIKNFHHLINNYITTDKFSLELLSVHYRTDPKNAANEFITTELETTIQNKDYVNFCSLHNRFNQFIETFTNKINNLNNNDYKNIVHIAANIMLKKQADIHFVKMIIEILNNKINYLIANNLLKPNYCATYIKNILLLNSYQITTNDNYIYHLLKQNSAKLNKLGTFTNTNNLKKHEEYDYKAAQEIINCIISCCNILETSTLFAKKIQINSSLEIIAKFLICKNNYQISQFTFKFTKNNMVEIKNKILKIILQKITINQSDQLEPITSALNYLADFNKVGYCSFIEKPQLTKTESNKILQLIETEQMPVLLFLNYNFCEQLVINKIINADKNKTSFYKIFEKYDCYLFLMLLNKFAKIKSIKLINNNCIIKCFIKYIKTSNNKNLITKLAKFLTFAPNISFILNKFNQLEQELQFYLKQAINILINQNMYCLETIAAKQIILNRKIVLSDILEKTAIKKINKYVIYYKNPELINN